MIRRLPLASATSPSSGWEQAAMTQSRMIAATLTFLALLVHISPTNAQTLPELRNIISDQLLYPRDARYTIPATLPVKSVDTAKNSEWLTVAEQLSKAGLIRSRQASGQTLLGGMEQSIDVVVPSTNLRYETTALNIVLGRWDIEVLKVITAGNVRLVHGKRRLTKRTRAYDFVVSAIPERVAAEYSDHDAVWEISGHGASLTVKEKPR